MIEDQRVLLGIMSFNRPILKMWSRKIQELNLLYNKITEQSYKRHSQSCKYNEIGKLFFYMLSTGFFQNYERRLSTWKNRCKLYLSRETCKIFMYFSCMDLVNIYVN